MTRFVLAALLCVAAPGVAAAVWPADLKGEVTATCEAANAGNPLAGVFCECFTGELERTVSEADMRQFLRPEPTAVDSAVAARGYKARAVCVERVRSQTERI